MGETGQAVVDSQQAESPVVTSQEPKGSTSATATYTEEQVQKRVSDALAKAGRESKAIETARADLAAREAQIKQFEQEREDAELDGVDATPAEKQTLKAYKDRLRAAQKAFNEQVEVHNKEKALWEGQINQAKETQFETTLNQIAAKHNVSAEALKAKAVKMNLKDEGAIEEIAEIMPKKVIAVTPDSGKGVGGADNLSKLSPRELISLGLKKNK